MRETEIRDFIAENFGDFQNFVVNYAEFRKDLKSQAKGIREQSKKDRHVLISSLIKLSVINKMLSALPILENLKLIDKEFTLLNTPSGRGKQPAVDILAYNDENYCLALIELKISDSAEREAVTELSAYNQGLQNRYRGLSALEVLWIPISTAWRTTTKSAIEFEILWQNTFVLPLELKADYDEAEEKIKSLELRCFNPVQDIQEIESFNLFSYECFDAFDYCTMEKVPNRKAFINYVTAVCARQKINGFIIFHKPVALMYPYGFTLCIFNPYKGALHKRISVGFAENEGEDEYLKALSTSRVVSTDLYDVDFQTDHIKYFEPSPEQLDNGTLKYDAYWQKDFLNVGAFAEDAADNLNIHYMVEKIRKAIDSDGENSRAFGTPNFEGLFRSLTKKGVDSVMYLGVYLELMSDKIMLENEFEPKSSSFFKKISSFKYLKKTLRQYNYK